MSRNKYTLKIFNDNRKKYGFNQAIKEDWRITKIHASDSLDMLVALITRPTLAIKSFRLTYKLNKQMEEL